MEPRPGTADDAILGLTPRLVFEPASVDEAADALARCAGERLAVGFVGGGTELGLGARPTALDAVLRTGRLDRVTEHAPADQIVTAEAGMTLGALQRVLAPHGQMLALDPPWPDRATLGGIVATNAFGPRRARYGSVRDLVVGATMVRADGTRARGGGKVVKNVAGFDIPRLLVGSLGSLGLVATVTFRLHPLPESAVTVLVPGVTPARAWELAQAWRGRQLEPTSAAALAGQGGGAGAPDALDVGVRFEGFAPGVEQQVERLLDVVRGLGSGAERLDDAATAAFWRRHDAVRTGDPLRIKVSAPPSRLDETYRSVLGPLLAELEQGGAAWYPGLGLGFIAGSPRSAAGVARVVDAARGALTVTGGSLVVCEAPGEVRAAVDPWGPPPPAFALMEELKERLDPDRRLNPGRFVGGL